MLCTCDMVCAFRCAASQLGTRKKAQWNVWFGSLFRQRFAMLIVRSCRWCLLIGGATGRRPAGRRACNIPPRVSYRRLLRLLLRVFIVVLFRASASIRMMGETKISFSFHAEEQDQEGLIDDL